MIRNNEQGAILIDAARCWRTARDRGQLAQPCLSQALADRNCAMLVPALDSLISLFQAGLGRPLATGSTAALSPDEHLLIALVDGARTAACLGCPAGTASALHCAICSIRILLSLAPVPRPRLH